LIDVHLHVVPPNIPGAGSLSPVLKGSTDHVARIVRQQMQQAGVTHAFAMGSFSNDYDDPLGIEATLEIAAQVPGLGAIGIANPGINDQAFIRRCEEHIQAGQVVALKAYLGYIHAYPNDRGYYPYYQLAAQYSIPFFFHTGDTYSPYAKLKYAQPIHIDEVAVDFPETKFIMAHLGNPWMLEAAQVIYKNMNVWCDLSGLLISQTPNDLAQDEDSLADLKQRIQVAWRYAERPNRFLFGTDWPLYPIDKYAEFIRETIHPDYHQLVFEDNAITLFKQLQLVETE
jgi:predicted TIM-barrel fold metal-dependent hydrolase